MVRIYKQISISGKSKGTINIDAATLPADTHNYDLYADGKIINTKQIMPVK